LEKRKNENALLFLPGENKLQSSRNFTKISGAILAISLQQKRDLLFREMWEDQVLSKQDGGGQTCQQKVRCTPISKIRMLRKSGCDP
jgi:hypothetical protein